MFVQTMFNHLVKKPYTYSRLLYSRPLPPPNRQDMFLLGFVIGFMCGYSHPWRDKFK